MTDPGTRGVEENPKPPSGAPTQTPTFVWVLVVLVIVLIVVIILIALALRDPSFHCPPSSPKSLYHVRIDTGFPKIVALPAPAVPSATQKGPIPPIPTLRLRTDSIEYKNLIGDKDSIGDKGPMPDLTPTHASLFSIRAVEVHEPNRRVIIVGHGFTDNMILLWDNRIQYRCTRISSDVVWVEENAAIALLTYNEKEKERAIGSTNVVRSTNVQGVRSLYDAWTSSRKRNTLRLIKPSSESCLFLDASDAAEQAFLSFTNTTDGLAVLVRQCNTGNLLSSSTFNNIVVEIRSDTSNIETGNDTEDIEVGTSSETQVITNGMAQFERPFMDDSVYAVMAVSRCGLQDILSYKFYI